MLPTNESAAWGFYEWATTGVFTIAGIIATFVWWLVSRTLRMSNSIDSQRTDYEKSEAQRNHQIAEMNGSLMRLHDEHYRLREALAMQPTKQDLIATETKLSAQLDRVVQRIDSLIAR